MLKNINPVKDRCLPLPPKVEAGLEKELNLNDFDWENKKHLGSGAFASVYEVFCKPMKMKVALKVLNKGMIKKEHNIPQVAREVSLMYSVSHPSIIKLYNHFEDDESIYLLMDLAPGGNLIDKLTAKGYLPEKVALKYIIQIVAALQYLHSQSPPIIHRDLKPENVLLDKDDNCKLADFGSANQKNFTTTFCGTPLYMAPEMLLKSDYDQNLDVWSLGILIFELLSGKPPFNVPGELDKLDAQAVLMKTILETGLEFPKWFPTLAKDLLEKMLNKDPKKRLNIEGVANHQWLKSYEGEEEGSTIDIEKSRTRSRSIRYGFFADLQLKKRLTMNEIIDQLSKSVTEMKKHRILEDLNLNISNYLEQLNEMKAKFELLNIRFNRLNWFHEKIEQDVENTDDKFVAKIKKFKELTRRKEELNEKLKEEHQNYQKLEENVFSIELEILKFQQAHEFFTKDLSKITSLQTKQSELLAKKDSLIQEIDAKSEEIKKRKAETKDGTTENSGEGDLLNHFIMRAKYFIREHKKISHLNDNKNTKYNEMKKELKELEENFLKKQEELEKQLNFEYDESVNRLNADLEREKQYLEEDFESTRKDLEKKIQKLKLENYSLKNKVHINEEISKPRLESLNQLIERYQENKLTLENIIGQKEKKINEMKEVLKENEEYLEKKKNKHKITTFFYSSFGAEKKDKKDKEKEKDRKSEKEKEKERKSEKEKEKERKSNQK